MSNVKFGKTVSNGGIVLLHIGLLLLLVSLISQLQIQRSLESGHLFGREYKAEMRPCELWPFQELKMNVTAIGGGFTVYLLETDIVFPSSNETSWASNSTALQLFLKENPEKIILEDQIEEGQYIRSYFSTKFMTAVVVFYNPNSEVVLLHYEGTLRFFGSTNETRNIAVCAMPLGAVLSVPWWTDQWKQRKNKLE
jgi:hypothetical protein